MVKACEEWYTIWLFLKYGLVLVLIIQAGNAVRFSTTSKHLAFQAPSLGLGGVLPHTPPAAAVESSSARPGTSNCSVNWFEQKSDHFSFVDSPPNSFKQRYFLCHVSGSAWKPNNTILFYTGNEANVELYVNATGFAWENAAELNALLVFMEHRFYGESKIAGAGNASGGDLHLLTMEQALADYANAIYTLKAQWNSIGSNVIALGGSYGGMLAAWLRMKYPSAVQGAIAASAPILAFDGLQQFPQLDFQWDSNLFWRVVTRDATPAAGALKGCDDAVRRTWILIDELARTSKGRDELTVAFSLCPNTPIRNNDSDIVRLRSYLLNAWDLYAMGNFPYPSDYLVFQQTQLSNVTLPAFPVRVACEKMMNQLSTPTHVASNDFVDHKLLKQMSNAVSILYNVTKSQNCFELPSDVEEDGIWDYQYCTEMLPQETYFTLTGTTDMFWSQPMNMTFINQHCAMKFEGTVPRPDWIAQEFGGIAGASNIVFSNGFFDPWSSGGVLVNNTDAGVHSILIPNGAHHLDLMFSDPRDPPDVIAARQFELAQIKLWLKKDVH